MKDDGIRAEAHEPDEETDDQRQDVGKEGHLQRDPDTRPDEAERIGVVCAQFGIGHDVEQTKSEHPKDDDDPPGKVTHAIVWPACSSGAVPAAMAKFLLDRQGEQCRMGVQVCPGSSVARADSVGMTGVRIAGSNKRGRTRRSTEGHGAPQRVNRRLRSDFDHFVALRVSSLHVSVTPVPNHQLPPAIREANPSVPVLQSIYSRARTALSAAS